MKTEDDRYFRVVNINFTHSHMLLIIYFSLRLQRYKFFLIYANFFYTIRQESGKWSVFCLLFVGKMDEDVAIGIEDLGFGDET